MTSDASSPTRFGASWQTLGELELTADSRLSDEQFRAWLAECLSPLGLNVEFLNKVLKSAQDSTARLLSAHGNTRLEHIHLILFASTFDATKRQSWGFFRIEKIDEEEQTDPPDHTIEIYLYVENF